MTALIRQPGRRTGPAGPVEPLYRAAPALAAVALVVTLAGCGSSGDTTVNDPGAAPSASASASASGAGATDLRVVVVDGTETSTWTLTCDPPGGDHPNPGTACATLAADRGKALEPVAKGMMCTQLFGGSQTATISGSYLGAPVQSSFSRTNGCEIARWKALTGLLPAEATGPL